MIREQSDVYDQRIRKLRELARDKNLRDARKLHLLARSKGTGYVSQHNAATALRDSIQRQILAPPSVGVADQELIYKL
jgi:hypothetical protein